MTRKANIGDIGPLSQLLHGYRLFYQKPNQEREEIEFLRARLSRMDSLILLGFTAGNPEVPAGFAQVYHSFSTVQLGPILILNDLYVDEKFRGRGLGEELIRGVIRYMQNTGCRKILLQTNLDNFKAQRLYERLGFKKESLSLFYEYFNL